MGKKYVVRLSEQEREKLESVVKKGTVKAYRVNTREYPVEGGCQRPWMDGPENCRGVRVPLQYRSVRATAFRGRGTGAGLGPQEATTAFASEVAGRRARSAADRTQLRPTTARTSPLDAAPAQPTAGGDGDRGDDQP